MDFKVRAISLVELLFGVLLMMIVIYGVSFALLSLAKGLKDIVLKAALYQEVSLMANHILLIGRMARGTDVSSGCKMTTSSSLDCSVDFDVPPSGQFTKVRFEKIGGRLFYLRDLNQDGILDINEAQMTIGNSDPISGYEIIHFDICDNIERQSGNCTLEPPELNVAMNGDRFFRFRIIARSRAGCQVEYQSAFYVRNPAPVPNLVYQVGSLQ